MQNRIQSCRIQVYSRVLQLLIGILTGCMLLLIFNISAKAETIYTNPENGYEAIIEDDADLLDSEQEATLQGVMKDITIYGNVAFKTIDQNSVSTQGYIANYYRESFGTNSGTVFLIDMANRNIWIYSNGAIYQTVTQSYADTITDNIYTYASRGEYYDCAQKAFEQELTLLEGAKIAQPMKYLSNGFLAVTLALLINYFIARAFSMVKKPNNSEELNSMKAHQAILNLQDKYVYTKKIYSPVESGGSSGGSSGGGSSGGGGGHSF